MFSPESSLLICSFFPRMLGVIYLLAFFPFLFQIKGLIGVRGILPLQERLDFLRPRYGWRAVSYFPTLFWWNASDKMLVGVVLFGCACAALLVLGMPPWLLLPCLIVVHLSLITAGQEFLSFGWEMFFLEVAYNTFLLSLTQSPNLFAWVSLNLLIIRFHFQAGISKLQSGDPNWRNLSALFYHYETQPIPNPIAWYFHQLPFGFQKFSTAAMFFVELAVPFMVFGTQEMRLAAFVLFVSLQAFIGVSGNFSYLNYLTIVLVTLLIGDAYLAPLFGPPVRVTPTPLIWDAVVSVPAAALIILQLLQLWNAFFPSRDLLRLFSKIYRFHFVNRYGIFAVMTTRRYEIIVEGSDDGVSWKEYLFYYKPSEVDRRPRWIAPYQPRLDWQIWFVPFSYYGGDAWFENFLLRLLEGSPEVLKLLRYNPFPESPPRYVRALTYLYQFSNRKIRQRTGAWWVRTYLHPYSPVVSLDDA